ncbi:hypothetical protein EVG14_28840, partial [Klebsiella pneumoniae]
QARLLLNPRDIDIHLVNGNSCANWSSQHSYAVGGQARLLLNPRDIDIHLVNGNSCANWSSQHSYAVG